MGITKQHLSCVIYIYSYLDRSKNLTKHPTNHARLPQNHKQTAHKTPKQSTKTTSFNTKIPIYNISNTAYAFLKLNHTQTQQNNQKILKIKIKHPQKHSNTHQNNNSSLTCASQKINTGSTAFNSCKHRNTKRKQTRQNSANKNQPHQTTQNRGDETKNQKPKTHTKQQKRKHPCRTPSSKQDEATACFSLLFSLDFKSIKPIAKQKTQKIRHIKKMQTKHEFSVSRFRFHPGKSEGRM